MQLQKVRLHPFAGIADRTYEFGPGLNVVLGPNEVGKSTLVHGITCAFFESISYGKHHWEKKLQQFVPRGGGDTFCVSLDFLIGGEAFRVSKVWGGECRCEIKLPSGQVIRNADEVDQKVALLLQLKRGTWQNILIANQSSISSTLIDFETNSEEASNLAQILRNSSFETDGVSIEKLERLIDDQLSTVNSRWDVTANQPENGRGVENPWKQRVGTLLNAYYHLEGLKLELETVENYERELDAINQRVSKIINERDELQLFVNKNEPVVKAVKERQGLDLKLDATEKNEKRLREIQAKWPLYESEINRLEKSLQILEEEHGLLKQEWSHSQKYQQSAGKRNQLNAANEAAKVLEEKKKTLGAFKGLSTQLIEDFNAAIDRRERYAASMAAGKIQVRFFPESETKISLKAGLENAHEELATKDQPLVCEADGIVTLTSDQFHLEVESGDGKFSSIKEKYESEQVKISELLSAIEVDSEEEANQRATNFSNAKLELQRATTALDTILAGQTLEELIAACGEEIPAPKREVEAINNAILSNRENHIQQENVLEAKRADIKIWREEFESQDSVLDNLVDARTERQNVENQLKKLPPIPDVFDNFEAFATEFERTHGRLTLIKEEELPEVRNQQSILKANEPNHTTQELRELIVEANSNYSLEKRRLDSLMRVKAVFQQMKERLDSGTLDPWLHRLSSTIQQVTSNRYMDLNFDGGGVTRASGLVIPHELLSMGTKASLGFSIRLSMAAHFLEDLDGFIILDDPMVDLDADRQRKTADVLREFAERKQVILLTCHDAHAALLTESPLEIKQEAIGY